METSAAPASPIELYSTEDEGMNRKKLLKLFHKKWTHKSRNQPRLPVVASKCANGQKRGREKTPLTTDKLRTKSGQNTTITKYNTRPLRERRPFKFLGDRLFTSVVIGGSSSVNVVHQAQNTPDEEIGRVPKAASSVTQRQ